MNKFKWTLIYLIPFLAFTGCGKGFEANLTDLEKLENDVDASNIDVQEGETPKSVDQQILDSYMSEFNNLDREDIENLDYDIKSFEVQVDRRQNQVSGVSIRMHSMTNVVDSEGTSITSCNNLTSIRDTHITLTQLQSRDSIFLGRNNGYEFEIQCTDSDCDEMVAAIRRINSGPRGLILIGVKTGTITGGRSGSYSEKYTSRSVDIKPYFTVAVSPDEYISRCHQIGELERSSTDEDEEPSRDEPVDPTGGLEDLFD